MADELHYLSATEALAAFRDRSLSPVELTEAVLARADAVEGTVNALCHRMDAQALAQAREAEARYAGRGEPPRALEGIPLAIKEEEAVAGQPWTHGSLIYKDAIADHSSTFAQRHLDAGAIVHARTTAPEFSCAFYTQSRLHGITRNPWNSDYGVGGSSGGAGAALAAGTTTLASGSDIGGSIRVPAAANGVVGFKPPYGRVPCDPPYNLDVYCHCGPLARTVADTALYQNVIAGPDPSDIASLRPKLVLPETFEGIAGLRIALTVDFGAYAVDEEVRENTLAVGAALREAGAEVEEVDVRLAPDDVWKAAGIHFTNGFAATIAAEAAAHPELVTSYVAGFAASMERLADGGSVMDGYALEAQLYAPVADVLERFDALVCPTYGTRGLRSGDDYIGHGLEVGGVELEHHEQCFLTPIFNIMSRCPVLNVPSGFGRDGAPTGVQLVGRTYDDLTVFRIGAALEAVRPWTTTRPQIVAVAG